MSAAKPQPVPAASESDLPEGWVLARLPEIANLNMGQSPPGRTYNEAGNGLPFFQGKTDFGDRFPTVRVWCTAPKKVAKPGDVLISIRAPVGPTNVAEEECAIGRGLAALSPFNEIPTEFILFALRKREPELSLSGTGSTFTAINKTDLENLEIPLPPLAEQKRIVAKVDDLLARVNAARDRLARVPTILKRFRQAVLAAACSGRLTADWRDAHSDIEPADVLLKRMSEQRSAGEGRFASQVPRSPDAFDFWELPKSWSCAALDQLISEPLANGRSVVDANQGFPVLRLTAVRQGRIDLSARKIGAWDEKAAARFRVKRNDFLVARGNGSLKLVGRGGLVDCEPDPVAYPDTLIRVRVFNEISPNYLALFWDSEMMRRQIETKAHTTAGIHKISQEDMLDLVLAIPPTVEQQEIVRRIEALFKLADAIERRVAAATARADRLTQAILAKAFRGQLVPTEAELARRQSRPYEPASALLSRIRATSQTPDGPAFQRRETGPARKRRVS